MVVWCARVCVVWRVHGVRCVCVARVWCVCVVCGVFLGHGVWDACVFIMLIFKEERHFHHLNMKCSFPQDFHHCCHDMLVFQCFSSFTPQKLRRSFRTKNFAPQACSCSLHVGPFWPLLALVAARRFRTRTNGTPVTSVCPVLLLASCA